MNHVEPVATGESEQFAYENARADAEQEIYEALKDLFGVQGENLAFYLDCATPPSGFEAAKLLFGLRDEYQKLVQSRANAILEAAQED